MVTESARVRRVRSVRIPAGRSSPCSTRSVLSGAFDASVECVVPCSREGGCVCAAVAAPRGSICLQETFERFWRKEEAQLGFFDLL